MATIVKSRIVKIGNSQGVRIPKILLDQTNITQEIELEIVENQIVIRAINNPRAGWAEQFKEMAERGDDKLLDPEFITNDWDEEWEW